jgi:L-2-hydroxyglutarate oxidase LhgO
MATSSTVIIGGGVLGSSIAYHLSRIAPSATITIVEKNTVASGLSLP